MKTEVVGKTDVGRVREQNEDSFQIDEENLLLVVADGMGGHQAGEVASALAAKTVVEGFRGRVHAEIIGDEARDDSLAACLKEANRAVYAEGKAKDGQNGMGTTLVAAWLDGDVLRVGNVGDSRAYLMRGGKLTQISLDHSVVQEQVREGLMTPEEAAQSPYQNVLSRAVGTNAEVEVDIFGKKLKPGDRVLLCSDGLTHTLTDKDIQQILEEGSDLKKTVDALIAAANAAGGHDNITVILAGIG